MNYEEATMKKFRTEHNVIKFMLKWKRQSRLSLHFLYNLRVVHLNDGFVVHFDDPNGKNVENGLEFYMNYITAVQKKLAHGVSI